MPCDVMGQNYFERIFFVRHFDPLIELGSIYNNLVMDNKIRQALLEHLGHSFFGQMSTKKTEKLCSCCFGPFGAGFAWPTAAVLLGHGLHHLQIQGLGRASKNSGGGEGREGELKCYRHTEKPSDEAGPRGAFAPKKSKLEG